MGGISIDSALQVRFMLHALWSGYQAVVQEFQHSLTTASLQTVVDQCVSYDKDAWKGPVSRDGKPARTTLANATNSDPDNSLYAGMAAKPFNFHMSRWQKAVLHNKGECLFCFNTSAQKTGHKLRDCPIMKKVGLKFESPSSDASRETASGVTTEGTTPTPTTPSVSTTNSNPAGSATVPGAFSASTKMKTYDSVNGFDYEGKCEGTMYYPRVKLTAMVSILA